MEKSTAYFGGVPDTELAELQMALPIPKGSMPFKYLGVPLSSKKLNINQCRPLVEKVVNRIKGWTTRFLSYAGRFQLIKGELFGVET